MQNKLTYIIKHNIMLQNDIKQCKLGYEFDAIIKIISILNKCLFNINSIDERDYNMKKPKYHVFVCNGTKANGKQVGICHQRGSRDIFLKLDKLVSEYNISDEVLVSSCGCFRNHISQKGPNMVVYPDGIWYSGVSIDDVEEIVQSHLKNGQVVNRLVPK